MFREIFVLACLSLHKEIQKEMSNSAGGLDRWRIRVKENNFIYTYNSVSHVTIVSIFKKIFYLWYLQRIP